jgi:hypothetical protein
LAILFLYVQSRYVSAGKASYALLYGALWKLKRVFGRNMACVSLAAEKTRHPDLFFADEMEHNMAILLLNDLYVTTLSEAVQRAAYDIVSSFVCFPSAPLVRAPDSLVEIAFC